MAGVEDEAGRLGDSLSRRVEDLRTHVGDSAAALAQQVEVGVVGEVIDGPTMAQMHVVDDLELGERVEGSVHR